MDLNRMLRPAKSPEKCTLQLLEQPAAKLVSLFEQKTVKGWWPCACEQNGEKIIAVSWKKNTDGLKMHLLRIFIYKYNCIIIYD